MKEIKRRDLHTISKCSNITETVLQQTLESKVYPDKKAWYNFLKTLFLALAVGFTVTGIIFFFAYNWDNLNKFAKLGIVQVLIITGVIFILKTKANLQIKNIILTGVSILVGALFAVFGQIYQTGANAYDFFLGWTVFITIWVIISNYAPLWLLFSILLNTTLYFYTEQVTRYWSDTTISLLFLVLNYSMLFGFTLLSKYKSSFSLPNWYYHILSICVAFFATFTLIFLNESDNRILIILSSLFVVIIYLSGIIKAILEKSIFYIALISLSIIATIVYYFAIFIDDYSFFLFIAIFSALIFSITIKMLLDLQKKWNNGK